MLTCNCITLTFIAISFGLVLSNSQHLSVAVIGCGPSAISLLHALQVRKDKLKSTSAEFNALPEIICFEQASGPGGIWRNVAGGDKARNTRGNRIAMYEDLWLNGPKEVMEYFDYSFDEHFQRQTPPYIPRQDVLEYVLKRNSRNGALDSALYNHTVLEVTYKSASGDFLIEYRNENTRMTTARTFDRVVWACGQNGEPNIPADIIDFLKSGDKSMPSNGFQGVYYHAVEATDRFEDDVKGKKIMLIGDSSSAEDLALRAIKYGVDHIYILARSGDGDASQTGS